MSYIYVMVDDWPNNLTKLLAGMAWHILKVKADKLGTAHSVQIKCSTNMHLVIMRRPRTCS